MDFALSDEQNDFVDAIRNFCDRECGTQDQRERLTDGYVERVRSDEDKRVVRAVLTDAGREAVEEATDALNREVFEAPEAAVGVAAVGVGEGAEVVGADELGELDRRIQLGQGGAVVALLHVATAPVGADAHDLHGVAGPLAAEAFERAAMKLPIKTKVVARLGDVTHLGGE